MITVMTMLRIVVHNCNFSSVVLVLGCCRPTVFVCCEELVNSELTGCELCWIIIIYRARPSTKAAAYTWMSGQK